MLDTFFTLFVREATFVPTCLVYCRSSANGLLVKGKRANSFLFE